ncbi:hypothetical protein B4U80_05232 [Leptotrombidium deliense]|uniref:ASD2 domain-containing protein n=1 Tax=Leptotrombidium deliense TaxID=299467 RepID=A0A443SMY5_9ACAR|nr:hypothetical protein B4U80_05232 [Leptotrombidium deliense]
MATTPLTEETDSAELVVHTPPSSVHSPVSGSSGHSSNGCALTMQSVAVSVEDKDFSPNQESLTIISTISSSPSMSDSQHASVNTSITFSKADMATQTIESAPKDESSVMSAAVNVSVSTEVNGVAVDDPEMITTNNNHCQSSVPWSYNNLWPKYGLRESTPSVCSERGDFSQASNYNNNNGSFTGEEYANISSAQLLDKDLKRRKELKSRLERKLEDLRSKEGSLNRDLEANESLGSQLLSKLKLCGISSQESEKISLHCEEIEKVTRLLLSLRTRLKQIDTEMKVKSSASYKRDNGVGGSELMPEMKLLYSKRSKLLSQLEEAIQLRDSIDRRSDLIAERILKKYFKDVKDDSLADFVEYLKLKAKLIVELKEVKECVDSAQKQMDSFE